jgi:polyribonucleotide nucleotidyltransferase
VGKIYTGRVTSVKDFGAFIEILPGKDGLCHISELAEEYVSSVGDVCRVGDELRVKVISIDEQDRVKLSRKAVLREEGGGGDKPAGPPREGDRPERAERGDRGDRGDRDRGGRPDRGRGNGGRGGGRGRG